MSGIVATADKPLSMCMNSALSSVMFCFLKGMLELAYEVRQIIFAAENVNLLDVCLNSLHNLVVLSPNRIPSTYHGKSDAGVFSNLYGQPVTFRHDTPVYIGRGWCSTNELLEICLYKSVYCKIF